MQDTEIYIKTDAGRDEIRSRTLGLPMSVRAILLMVDGQRPVSAMRSLIAGSKAPADVLDALFQQGLIAPRDGAASTPPAPVAAPPERVVQAPSAPPQAAPVAPPQAAYDGPLDLVLPTIYGPEPVVEVVLPPPNPAPAVAPQVAAAPVQAPLADATPVPVDSYEHLYTMMNEIVRDFLAPHRRYFIQLKIERCTTSAELLELLHDLQTALAKSRGEAFASDVISRLRNAAV